MKKKNLILVTACSVIFTLTVVWSSSSQKSEVTGAVEVAKFQPQAAPSLTFKDNKYKTVRVERVSVNPNRVVYIDGEIGPNASLVVRQLKELDKSKDPVYLFINSPGGSVFDGALIISQIEAMQAPVTTVCTQLCASMAAMIHQYGHTRAMIDRAVLMFHPASGGVRGQVPNINSRMAMISRYVEKMNHYIVGRSGIDNMLFRQLVAYEIWIDAEDAKEYKFIEKIISTDIPTDPVVTFFNP